MKILHRYTKEVLLEVEGANLERANLIGADLIEADLGGANMGGADLGGADLGGANLGGANLGGANLEGTNLREANLGGANLRGADLEVAHPPVNSHQFVSGILWRESQTEQQKDFAARIGKETGECWKYFIELAKQKKVDSWAKEVLCSRWKEFEEKINEETKVNI